ncbi:MAG: HesA/MoeB/ThiF family protein [Pseudomonadota bacterium]
MSETITKSDNDDLHDPAKRYARHVVLPEIGGVGQQKLAAAKVAIIGLGGLGSPAAQFLAAAGVGHLTLIDHDEIALSNLQRQILFQENDIGQQKVSAAAARLVRQNSRCVITPVDDKLTNKNAEALIADHDVVIDATDLVTTRYIINDACDALQIPWVMGAVIRFEGQVAVFDPRQADAPSYRTLFPELPPPDVLPACAEAGVIGPMAGIIGAWQAMEALKLITGAGTVKAGRTLNIDGLYSEFFETGL